jgi:hypothetical protein
MINITARDKIMVNLPEVHLNIKRQYPEVGHKNEFILSYTIHLGRFIINTR